MRALPEVQIFSYLAKLQLAFTAATTDIITATAHGLSVDDCIQVASSTTLPAGLAATTNYYVIEVLSADTFKISATQRGTSVDITDTGTGTHTFYLKGKKIDVNDFKHVIVTVNTANSANLTYKFQGATQDSVDFNASQGPTNRWDYIRTVDLNSGTAIAGDTGYALTGTDDNRIFEVNTNGLSQMTVVFAAWTAGTAEIRVRRFVNDKF